MAIPDSIVVGNRRLSAVTPTRQGRTGPQGTSFIVDEPETRADAAVEPVQHVFSETNVDSSM